MYDQYIPSTCSHNFHRRLKVFNSTSENAVSLGAYGMSLSQINRDHALKGTPHVLVKCRVVSQRQNKYLHHSQTETAKTKQPETHLTRSRDTSRPSTGLAHHRVDRSSRRPDHGPVPPGLPGPPAQAPTEKHEGQDEDEEEPQADHGHGDEGGLRAEGVDHGVDVEGYREGDGVLEAAYQG